MEFCEAGTPSGCMQSCPACSRRVERRDLVPFTHPFLVVASPVAVVLVAAPQFVAGQLFSGSLRGVVTDSSDFVVPASKITARNVGTDIEATTKTDAEGRYVFAPLQSGRYAIVVKSPGFRRFQRSAFDLQNPAGPYDRREAGSWRDHDLDRGGGVGAASEHNNRQPWLGGGEQIFRRACGDRSKPDTADLHLAGGGLLWRALGPRRYQLRGQRVAQCDIGRDP